MDTKRAIHKIFWRKNITHPYLNNDDEEEKNKSALQQDEEEEIQHFIDLQLFVLFEFSSDITLYTIPFSSTAISSSISSSVPQRMESLASFQTKGAHADAPFRSLVLWEKKQQQQQQAVVSTFSTSISTNQQQQ